jgi:ribosomal protein S18 acetylase RimI-like enzyme
VSALTVRPATRADLTELTELQRRWDTAYFGAPEHDRDEVNESFSRAEPLAERSRLVHNGERVVGAAYCWSDEAVVLVDPAVEPEPVLVELLGWCTACEPISQIDALDRDHAVLAALAEHGWTHTRSAFDLIRDVTADWELATPDWPPDIEVRSVGAYDAEALYRLIYDDAGWAEIAGHNDRSFENWRGIFLGPDAVPDQQVLAWRDAELVGAVLGRIFSDGAGWVAQLAVAKSARRHGLGRALLLEAFHRHVRAGATKLGLSVQAGNRGALDLYLAVGLTIDREWLIYNRA